MSIPTEAWLVLITSIVSGSGCTLITCAVASRRMRGLYNRGWTAGRNFASRQAHDLISK